jgi:hypothetical protein
MVKLHRKDIGFTREPSSYEINIHSRLARTAPFNENYL